eukprot:GHVT01058342.1.p1 GENE.GHVT01058342.1~~GHVT01058342.1.p1  ORF type:complete len:150 (-),score=6.37 GHVT01058342.1:430-879(-)
MPSWTHILVECVHTQAREVIKVSRTQGLSLHFCWTMFRWMNYLNLLYMNHRMSTCIRGFILSHTFAACCVWNGDKLTIVPSIHSLDSTTSLDSTPSFHSTLVLVKHLAVMPAPVKALARPAHVGRSKARERQGRLPEPTTGGAALDFLC